jgi:hypothetical protein
MPDGDELTSHQLKILRELRRTLSEAIDHGVVEKLEKYCISANAPGDVYGATGLMLEANF